MSNKRTQDLYDNTVTSQTATQGSLVDFAKKRWNAMAFNTARTDFEERCERIYWLRDTYEEGMSYMESFNRAVRFPTLNTIITDQLDDLVEILPETEYVALDEDLEENKRRAKLVTKARDDFAEKGNKRYEVYEALRHAYTEGMGVFYVGRARTLNPNGTVLFDGIDYEAINPLNFYIDENATVLHDPKNRKGARDVFRHHRMSRSTWEFNLEKNDLFYNKDAVKAQNEQVKTRFTDREYNEDSQGKIQVDVLEYWNREIRWNKNGKEMIGVHAVFSLQGSTMIEHFVEESQTIPFAIYYGEKRDDSIYGVPLAEKLAHVIIGQDQQMTIAFREANLTLMPPAIIRADAGYNRRKHTLRAGGVWQLKIPPGEPISNAFSFLQRPQLPNDFYNLRNIFDEELIKVSKQDQRSLLRNPNQLATQTRARMQAEQKKLNAVVKLNTWNAERIIARLELEVIDRHLKFPLELGDGKKRARIITVKGFDVFDDKKIPELVQSPTRRRGQFKLTKDLLDTDFEVMVVDRKEKRILDGDREGRLLQFLQLRTNLLAIPPNNQEKITPLIKAIGEILGLKEEEIDPVDEVSIKSPRDQQLEMIALGVTPAIDPSIPQEELLDLRISWVDFKATALYEGLSAKMKRGIEDVIEGIETLLTQPKEQRQPQGQQVLPKQQNQSAGGGGGINQPSPQLQSPTALAGGAMQTSLNPQ